MSDLHEKMTMDPIYDPPQQVPPLDYSLSNNINNDSNDNSESRKRACSITSLTETEPKGFGSPLFKRTKVSEELSSSSVVTTPTTNSPENNKINSIKHPPCELNNESQAEWGKSLQADLSARKAMVEKVIQHLRAIRGDKYRNDANRLITQARQLELGLYKSSTTKEEYLNIHTLQSRIHDVVRNALNSRDKSGSKQTPSTNSYNSKEEMKALIKKRQRRLLLLQHGSSCREEKCTTSPDCEEARNLWQHIIFCRLAECKFPSCVSSRYLIMHYQNCKAEKCQICAPVRVILRSQKTKRERTDHPQDEDSNIGGVQSVFSDGNEVRNELNMIQRNGSVDLENQEPNGIQMQNFDPFLVQEDRIEEEFARACVSGTGPNLLSCKSSSVILAHIKSLKVEKLQNLVFPILRKLMEHKSNKDVFNTPVDVVLYNIPHYYDVVKKPLDLGTIRQRLEDGRYEDMDVFNADVKLVFDNAMIFNPPTHVIHANAQQLWKYYEAELAKILLKAKIFTDQATVSTSNTRMASLSGIYNSTFREKEKCQLCFQEECEICPLCERGCLAYEPKVIYCSGNCNARIQRNVCYWATANYSYCFCTECYDKNKRKNAIEVAGGSFCKKSELEKRKNNDLHAEPWVQCDKCTSWFHQVCSLFNSRKDDPSKELKYTCPNCLLQTLPSSSSHSHVSAYAHETSDSSDTASTSKKSFASYVREENQKLPLCAKDLKRTHLDRFLEKWIRSYYSKFQEDELKNPPKVPGESGPDADKLHVRVLHNYDEYCKVKPFARLALSLYPQQFKFRSKCIVLFQELDGIDVLIFAMFVQEYGSDSCAPNSNKLYIAYLDSVHYFRPRRMRTYIYHELLLSYLEYNRRLGFVSAYIWACPPPNKRDDYIIHCHPEDQRVPNAERLRKWYWEMVKKGKKYNIIVDSNSLHQEHFEPLLKESRQAKQKRSSKNVNYKEMSKYGFDDIVQEKPNSKSNGIVKKAKNKSYADAQAAECEIGDEEACVTKRETVSVDYKFAGEYSFSENTEVEVASDALTDSLSRNKLAVYQQMPYFDGDYWPQELEEIAKDEEQKRSKKQSVRKSKPDSVVEDEVEPGKVPSNLESCELKDLSGEQLRKVLFKRLGVQLLAMRHDFLVIKLTKECTVCGEPLPQKRYECRHPSCCDMKPNRLLRSKFVLCEDCYRLEQQKPKNQQHGFIDVMDMPDSQNVSITDSNSDYEMADLSSTAKPEDTSICVHSLPGEEPITEHFKNGFKQGANQNGVASFANCSEGVNSVNDESLPAAEVSLNVGTKAAESLYFKPEFDLVSSRTFDNTVTEKHVLICVTENIPKKTIYIDESWKNKLFENRHTFLALCAGNRYQFNQLRRAKFSSMMVLYHLHNPKAPAHLFTCSNCRKDILQGSRLCCQECNDFNLCETCYADVGHEHKMNQFVISRGIKKATAREMYRNKAEARRANDHSMALYLRLFNHSLRCSRNVCPVVPCSTMKRLISHSSTCEENSQSCNQCKRFKHFQRFHIKFCSSEECFADFCPNYSSDKQSSVTETKENNKNLLKIKLKLPKPSEG